MNSNQSTFRVQTSMIGLTGRTQAPQTIYAQPIGQESFGDLGTATAHFTGLQQLSMVLTGEDPQKVNTLIQGGKVVELCLLEDTQEGPRQTARVLILSSSPYLPGVLAELDEMLNRCRAKRGPAKRGPAKKIASDVRRSQFVSA